MEKKSTALDGDQCCGEKEKLKQKVGNRACGGRGVKEDFLNSNFNTNFFIVWSGKEDLSKKMTFDQRPGRGGSRFSQGSVF